MRNVYLCRKPCKVGSRYLEDGTKVRVSRGLGASGSIIPRPEILSIRTTPRPTVGNYPKLNPPCGLFSFLSSIGQLNGCCSSALFFFTSMWLETTLCCIYDWPSHVMFEFAIIGRIHDSFRHKP